MRLNLVFCIISVVFTVISCSCLNDRSDGGNVGEALYLTKYIENGDIETAQKLALVSHPEIPIKNYAAYLTVNKEYNSNLFFWFFPAKVNPDDAPVLLWLNGGPGEPSVFCAIAENGPYNISSAGNLIPNEYSWHLDHNLIYIDNPVGTGYSFTDSENGYSRNEKDVGQNLLVALHQFFLLFPKLQKNEFFVSGVSYAGKYVPAIGYAVYQDSKRETSDPMKPKINLKGLAIGNGWTDPIHQLNYADYFYQLGLIDSKGHKLFMKKQIEAIDCIKSQDFECAFDAFDRLIFGQKFPYATLFTNLTGFTSFYNFLVTNDTKDLETMEFIQKSETRRAIHVGNNSFHMISGENKIVFDHLKLDILDSVADWVAKLLSHYPMLFYNGQLDIIVPYPLTEHFLHHLEFNGAEQYKTAERHIWRVDNEVAGYTKQAGNLTEVLVRNAGHSASIEQPKWALDILFRFTHHKCFN